MSRDFSAKRDFSALVPVSYVIFRRRGSVLLQLREGTGYLDGHWATAAAGHVEPGESVQAAARREAAEELGVVIAAEELVPLTVMHRAARPGEAAGGRVDFFFSCESWTGSPRIMEPSKAAGLAWFCLADLPEAVVPHERYVLERLAAGLPAFLGYGLESYGFESGAAGEHG
ncbi:NUDIX domain-containing protein [Arthrobacter sp. H35-D1]|uniref:NUDIX domain-containing protein n=1 Tax=Arthrobacter sp. H35-D1 TaxID=3046202 RepID=UPI0024B96BDA|nr:NUDIX domain-containing protein [Arthrobacter sp. H35-D1]MDJ0314166.1 NUDIX domain-containing protein [Arthrobacter sp. H35-D1]